MKRFIVKSLADLRFAIFLLLLIASFSIIGTIIEQDQILEYYQNNYPVEKSILGFINWKFIIQLGFDHIYKTIWFITLLIIFGCSLLSCTFLQQLPSLKIAQRCQFFRTTNQFKKLKIKNQISNKLVEPFLYNLVKQDYSIFHQRKIIYGYKGLIGRIAPIIVHISMILILLGAVLGAIGGFNAQEIVPKSEIFSIQNILNRGNFAKISNVSTRTNDFWITYNKETTINQFYSNLSFLDKSGNEILNKTISVNHPAKYKNITYYQTDWNLIGLRLKIDNNTIQCPLISPFTNKEKVWISWLPFDNTFTKGVTVLINNLQGYVSIYNEKGEFVSNLELNDTLSINDHSFTLIDIISSTGLQIKTDPGIITIYTGFGFLMFSTLISYTTYSQIWILKKANNIFIGGNTNRAKFEFEVEFKKLINENK